MSAGTEQQAESDADAGRAADQWSKRLIDGRKLAQGPCATAAAGILSDPIPRIEDYRS